MLPLFTTLSGVDRGNLLPSKWDYVRRVLQSNVEAAQVFRAQSYNAPVTRNEFFQNAILNFPVSFLLSMPEFIEQAKNVCENFSQALRITSPLSPGNAFSGNFVNGNVGEFYLLVEDDDFEYAKVTDWKKLRPVWYLDHPSTSLAPAPLSFQQNPEGIAVIAVDLVKLIYMYRRFAEETLSGIYTTQDTRSIQMFAHLHVLPNMLDSQIDIAVFNRLNEMSMWGKPTSSRISAKLPHPYVDIDQRCDDVLKEALELYTNAYGVYESILQSTPSVYHQSAYQELILPDSATTYNCLWLQVVSRLKMYDFLLRIGGKEGIRVNQHHINRLVRIIRAWGVVANMRNRGAFARLDDSFAIIGKLEGLV